MNQDDTIKKLVNNWIKKADNDLLAASRELSFDEPLTDIICFHCQQSAEKYLKAFLVYHQIYFNKTHNIIDLIKLCSTVDVSFKDLEEADILTDYAVDIRYPDVLVEPDLDEAKQSLAIAKQVKEFILKKLKINFIDN